ncbi:UNVERIFIED_CONTAM: hypothetical protein Sradi_0134400, partial [Sesamum radiatum]
KSFSLDTQHGELLLEESNEATPQLEMTSSSSPEVPIDDTQIPRRSTRLSHQPMRYRMLGMTSQLDNDAKTFEEVMSDIDLKKWLQAIRFEMDSLDSNKLWILVDAPKGVRPVGCKSILFIKI